MNPAVPAAAAKVESMYAELCDLDGLLADSLWHRMVGWRRYPQSTDALAQDLRCALTAAKRGGA